MANNSLRSFASGMVIATSILTAIYYLQPQVEREQKIIVKETLTDDKVQQYLNEKGYLSISKQEYDDLLAIKTKSKENETKVVPGQKVPKTAANQNNNTATKPQNPQTTIPNNSGQPQKSYTLTVKPGMDSIQIVTLLEKAGIIDDGRKFDQFLTKKDWTGSIQIGTYKLNNSMSFEEIGKIITKK